MSATLVEVAQPVQQSTPFNETCKVALFGANSTGKTLQIRSLIESYGAENVGIVSCEHGLSTIRSSIKEGQVRECANIKDFRSAWSWALETYQGLGKWICVDGGTRAMQWLAGEVWAGTDAAYSLMATGTPKAEIPMNLRPYLRFITGAGEIDGMRQWIQIGRDADFELNRWVKLPCNSYWTFWEVETSLDQYRKGKPWQVDSPGTAGRDSVYGTFDFIMRLTNVDGVQVATHDPGKRIVRSKARDDWAGGIKVPNEQVGFNLAAFTRLIRGEAK